MHQDDQDKSTFTYLYGTFMYDRISFNLCNAPVTFQRAMMKNNLDLIENVMDDFSVYGTSFDECLNNLTKVLQRCEKVYLVFN
jgi:hypothetical protein